MLRQRLLLGPVLIAALIGIIWLDAYLQRVTGIAALIILPAMVLIGIMAGRELGVIFKTRGIRSSRLITCIAVVLGLVVSSFTARDHAGLSGVAIVCTAAGFVLLGSMIYYARNHTTDGVLAATAVTLLAFVYVGLMGGFLVVLRKEHDGWLILGILLITKAYDIGAYFTGRAIGRHKLIPWLSPGKTWEGLVGGLLVASGMGVLCVFAARWTGVAQVVADLNPAAGAVLGLLFGLVGQGGDLMASLLKRDAGVKDYSSVLPGFGGVLDVIDSPLLVAPVAYWTLAATANILST